jgi:hypothetical protein
MAAANKAAMEALMEQINAILSSSGKNHGDKENTPPTGNNSGTGKTTKRQKKKCKNCGKMVLHKPKLCYELEANAASRWDGWKSSKVVEASA